MNASANHSDCAAPVNSGRGFTTASLSASVAHEAVHTGVGSHIVTITGSVTAVWTRLPFPRTAAAVETAPGEGGFFVAQACCARCRAAFIFGTETYNSSPEFAGVIQAPITLHVSDQATNDDGDPDGDPATTTIEKLVSLRLWRKADAPCKAADGPAHSPQAILYLPEEPLFVVGENPETDDIETSVSGTYTPLADESGLHEVPFYRPFLFTLPEPCADLLDFEMTVGTTWAMEGVTATAAIHFSLVIS